MTEEPQLPRWTERDRLHPIEREIYDLAQQVEDAGAHPDLTDASVHLFDALRALVRWFDAGQPGVDFDAGNQRPLTQDDERLIAESWERLKPHFEKPPYGGKGIAQ